MHQVSITLFGVLATLNLLACNPVSQLGCGCDSGHGYSSRGLYDNYRSCGSGFGGYGGPYRGVGGFGGGFRGLGGSRGATGGFGGFGGVIGAGGLGGGAIANGGSIVQPVVTPGRIIVQEAPTVVPDYVESEPTVILQEAAPRFVFGDANPIRLNHVSRPAVIEHFDTPYIIDAVQRSAFINHAAQPVIIDHYEEPEVIRDEGLPVIYEACDCGVNGCNGGCGCSSAAIISAPCL